MAKSNKETQHDQGITRKEFLRRLSFAAVGLLGFRYVPAFGLESFDSGTISDSSEYMLVNARLIDGTGSGPAYPRSIHIRDGLIAAIGEDLPMDGRPVLDLQGATIMPGIIDSHVHLTSVPGTQFRGDSDETAWAFRYGHLKSYLAAGVTTVLDTGISASALENIQAYLNSGGIGPRLYALGPSFVKKDGYIDAEGFYDDDERYLMCPPAETQEDVMALFERFGDIPGIIGAKMFIEQGFSTNAFMDAWDIHDETMRTFIKDQAHDRNIPLWVHAMSRGEQTLALSMNPRAIAHVGFMDEYLGYTHLNRLLDAGVYVNSTQVIPNLALGDLHEEWFEKDALALSLVPPDELATALESEAWEAYHKRMFDFVVPEEYPLMPEKMLEKALYNTREFSYTRYAKRTAEALVKMNDFGIPIAMGSDSGGLPFSLNYFHGLTSILEMEYMAGAGMSPADVLVSSTRIPAEMMGLSDKIGTIETGKCADLIVLEQDPLADTSAFRSLVLTIKDGVAKTPEKWMEG